MNAALRSLGMSLCTALENFSIVPFSSLPAILQEMFPASEVLHVPSVGHGYRGGTGSGAADAGCTSST